MQHPDGPEFNYETMRMEVTSFTVFGFPDEETMITRYAVKISWFMVLIATRSVDEKIDGIKEIRERKHRRIIRGMIAYENLHKLRYDKNNPMDKAAFEAHKDELAPTNLYETDDQTLIRSALAFCGNNQHKTAKLLGISRNTVRHRLRRYGMRS